MRRFILLFIFSIISIFIFAQDTTVIVVTGKVIDAESLTSVPSVFLLNTTKSIGAQSDTSGKYRILMKNTDSIRISCIGYYTQYWKPDFSKIKNNKIEQVIYITPQTYQLSAVDIFSTRWKSFAYDVLNTQIEENEVDKAIVKWFNETVNGQELSNLNPKSGIQIPLPIHTHREKQLSKISQLQKIEVLEQQANQKYNKQFVSDITGLKGNDLSKFMNYCSFDRDFILKTSEYDLIIIVQEIFMEYKQKNKN